MSKLEEIKVLEENLAILTRQYKQLQEIPPYTGEDFNLQVLEASRQRQKAALEIALKEPYFGRLDFEDFDEGQVGQHYIGKTGITDEETGNILIVDWRAPVASLFYAFSGSEDDVYYESPDGLVDGEIHLKRNLIIRENNVQRVVDSYVRGQQETSGGDEFLLYKLGEQKDNRLRDIVATIQGEQNKIIRHPRSEVVIIQGVAGSGKTTVALHRLAYLLYEYREQIRAERMIIFAPNSVFLDYISQVLPELGVGDIQQTTFSTWALTTIDDPKLKLIPIHERRRLYFETRTNEQIDNDWNKRTHSFKEKVDKELVKLEVEWLPTEDFEPWPGVIFRNKQLLRWINEDFKEAVAVTKFERTKARIKRWIEIEVKRFDDQKEQQQAKKKANEQLRSYLRKWKNEKPYDLYIRILKNLGKSELAPKRDQLELEDLAPLLHIQQKWSGIDKEKRFDHVVIDEAQDFSPYQLAVLKERTRGQSFTILGDLSQGIHSNEGIEEWQSFIDLFGETKTAYFEMDKSYRSTYEIIEFSNIILSHLENRPTYAKPVFRSGDDVNLQAVNKEEEVQSIVSWVNTMQSKGMNTVAIITRTEKETNSYYDQLKEQIPDLTVVSSQDQSYQGGLSILPVYVSKGLEFDAVLVIGADEQNYPKEPLATKLLYVACTRALHQLEIMYSGTLSRLLQK
ncbi:HelD family protein [Alkalihalobacillus sp. 1P02AB]|uniref:HelD family protein n=1 Tax=Alkalihalobacillus sp. 1P02AB TaxID=3132260 RepID=UPI0039A76B5E